MAHNVEFVKSDGSVRREALAVRYTDGNGKEQVSYFVWHDGYRARVSEDRKFQLMDKVGPLYHRHGVKSVDWVTVQHSGALFGPREVSPESFDRCWAD